MLAAPPRSPARSPWRTTRTWATLACVTALVAGLATLAAGHPLHGWLMVLGSMVLLKGTVWGRQSRRRAGMPMLTQQPPVVADSQKPTYRKAA